MNYLSHFYFDKSDDKYYNIGLVLPDLARNHIAKLRVTPKHNIQFSTKEIASINSGCSRHFECDRIFHNWEFFMSLSEECTEIIREHGEKDIDRDYFFVHVFIEIILDRILLKKNPTLADDFYKMMSEIEVEWLLRYLRYAGLHDDEMFKGSQRRFIKAAFLKDYLDMDKCISHLEKMGTRIGLKPFTEPQIEVLKEIAEIIESKLECSLDKLTKLLKQ